jgi:hypothetical protein
LPYSQTSRLTAVVFRWRRSYPHPLPHIKMLKFAETKEL